MLHHHETELSFAAYVVAVSVIIGALIVSGTVFYIYKNLTAVNGGVAVAGTGTQNAPGTADAGTAAIKLAPNTPFLGNPNAKVTVIEYADYRCPYCERFYQITMPDLQTKYIATGKIKFVYQDVAFLGPDSLTAGEGAYCALEQNKFWQFHDYMFGHQGDESTTWADTANEISLAPTMGLNASLFATCLNSGKYAKQVTQDTVTAQTYGVTGTPTIFVNGTKIEGAQDVSVFDQAIDAALK